MEGGSRRGEQIQRREEEGRRRQRRVDGVEADVGRRGESSAPRRSTGTESRGETDTCWVVFAGSSPR